ncbi:MAG: DUF115 domain-containing protein [Phycisphaerales bacterium]|nr:DUF115 domain-containing protein [Phycisphaerales bacterium]
MDFFSIDPFAPLVNATLERNLEALARTSPRAAQLIRASSPRADLQMSVAEDGLTTGVLGDGRRLASARGPLVEATRLADTVDITEAGGVCVVGFGLGHHLRVLGERLGKTGVLLCFEPDLGLLRSVFERVDHAIWMLGTNFVLLTEADDGAGISRAMSGMEGVVALGVRLIDHPASRLRLGDSAAVFAQRFTDVLKAIRTTLVTTLVQSETTLSNALMNLDHYAASAGINDLRGCAAGIPAVVVSAGPSLARNIEVLSRPGVRNRVVIIAVQTVLKTLLARGIRPHFVCALDHHEISRRFYEGLTAQDVEGVTLVVEPKANPAILDAFPGAIRCLGDDLLDAVVAGTAAARPRDRLKPGATVAHLCHYLARHMGCDPVILVGQDLGFSDGQYYASGAAIHDVWACELNEFTTLEMREWERIVRAKSLLRARVDVFGRKIYSDEQMSTYLAQFESDFAADTEAGLRVIDATEGGVAKQHTIAMSLADAIGRFESGLPISIPTSVRGGRTAELMQSLRSRLAGIRAEARRVHLLSRDTVRLLRKMRRCESDRTAMNDLVGRIHRIRDEVMSLQPAFRLAQFLNQSGALNRVRADRSIELAGEAGEMDRQMQRVERDIRNVESVAQAAQRLCALLEESGEAIAGGTKRTRDVPGDAPRRRLSRKRVSAVLHVDFDRGGLGCRRSLEEPVASGFGPLRLTVARLLSARRLREVICLTDDQARLRAALGDLGERVRIAPLDVARFRQRLDAVGAARRFSSTSWRGGVAQLTCYDELFDPRALADAVEQHSLDAAVLVGADWCAVDPGLIDAIVERYMEFPEGMRLTFTQAPPGLCGLLIDRSACQTLAQGEVSAGPLATIGGLLGYVPFAPQGDSIARPMCVSVPPEVRDLETRCIADTDHGRAVLAWALGSVDALQADAAAIARAIRLLAAEAACPQHLVLEICGHARRRGAWSQWLEDGLGSMRGVDSDVGQVEQLVAEMAPGSALTLHGVGDPMDHPYLARITEAARSRGVGTHLRTMLRGAEWRQLGEMNFDIISVDVLAITPGVYESLAGSDAYMEVRNRVETLLSERNERLAGVSLPLPWIVPRITRCDETIEQIEGFYDGWLLACGCAVIDPLPTRVPGARVQPLAAPRALREREARLRLEVRADGSVRGCPHVNVFEMGLSSAWRKVRVERQRSLERPLAA